MMNTQEVSELKIKISKLKKLVKVYQRMEGKEYKEEICKNKILEAVLKEREACAKLVENSVKPSAIANAMYCTMTPYELAKAIRDRE